ncbi:hypothetical protein LTR95_014639 [Oleoguttula sp. CCFEE 5521]
MFDWSLQTRSVAFTLELATVRPGARIVLPTLFAVAHPRLRKRNSKLPVHKFFGNLALRKTPPRSAQQVLAVPELLERILLACPVDRMMIFRAVCKHWNDLIGHPSPQLRVRHFQYGLWNHPVTDVRLLDYPTPGLQMRLGDSTLRGQMVEVEMDMLAARLMLTADKHIRDKLYRRSGVIFTPALQGHWPTVDVDLMKIQLNEAAQKAHYTRQWIPRYAEHAKLLVSQPPFKYMKARIVDSHPDTQPQPDFTGAMPMRSRLTAEIWCDAGIILQTKLLATQDSFKGLSVKFEGLVKWKSTDTASRLRLQSSDIEITRVGTHDWSDMSNYSEDSEGEEDDDGDDDSYDDDDVDDDANANGDNSNNSFNGDADTHNIDSPDSGSEDNSRASEIGDTGPHFSDADSHFECLGVAPRICVRPIRPQCLPGLGQ